MPDGPELGHIRVVDRIAAFPAAAWDACAGDANPFVSHAFLLALEASGSATAETGWLPQHLAIEDAAGRLVGAVPMYLKSHSYGEYVFDHSWADAFRRAGGRYYPKLQAAVPFTPVPGPRLLTQDPQVASQLVAALVERAEQVGVSSLHVTFPRRSDWERLGLAGFLQRIGYQFHWDNPGYASFDEFLAALSSRKRKAIRKERRAVAESGVVLHTLTGDAITEQHWDAFFRFYMSTSDRKWGQAYLTRGFFRELGRTMTDKVVLVMAQLDGRWIAGALNLRGRDTLYGRNWGAVADVPHLHFEACYYRAIDFAIEHGLKRVEAGAQGEHKLQRGYLPTETYSAHWIAHDGFRKAVSDFLARERQHAAQAIELLGAEGPFRQEQE